ncbi:hypothetical protein CP8484711_1421A, partial [Chlamydia psittaci 84-8471/1]
MNGKKGVLYVWKFLTAIINF